LLGNLVVLAAFTIVADGQIISVPTSGQSISGQAIVELAQIQGAQVTADPEAGVVSVTSSGKGVARLSGFKSRQLVVVVDGKIQKVSTRLVGGVPYISAADLQAIATSLGFQAQLDAKARVLALKALRKAPEEPAATGGVPDRHGLLRALQAEGGGSAPAEAAPGDVCGYMDQLKQLWDGTEPSPSEKATFRRLANDFQAMEAGTLEKDPAQLDVLRKTLTGFAAKVSRRVQGTQQLPAPSSAQGVKRLGTAFLGKVQTTVKRGQWLLDQIGPDSEMTREDVDSIAQELRGLDSEVQRLGRQFNQEVLLVRGRHGCGPP
jgi:hypothetical protein